MNGHEYRPYAPLKNDLETEFGTLGNGARTLVVRRDLAPPE